MAKTLSRIYVKYKSLKICQKNNKENITRQSKT
ncbi:hypothetical protein ACFW04_010174 [Cataglyphis niger]